MSKIPGLCAVLLLKNENKMIYGVSDRIPKYTMLRQQLLFLDTFVESVYIMDDMSTDGSGEVYDEFKRKGLIKEILSTDGKFHEQYNLGVLKNTAFFHNNKWMLYLDGDEILEDRAKEWIREFCTNCNPREKHTVRFNYINLWRSRNRYRFDKWHYMEAGKLFSLMPELESYGTEHNNHHFAFNNPLDFGTITQSGCVILHYAWVDWNHVMRKYHRFIDLEQRYNGTTKEAAIEMYNKILDEEDIILKPCEPHWLDEYRT